MMPVISDLELKRRLEAHNYPVPPITETTKKILVKKLNQLDKEASRQVNKLIDYSSAEDDVSANPSPHLRRRKVTASTSNGNGTSHHNTRRSEALTSYKNGTRTVQEPYKVQERQSQLVHMSDEDQTSSSEEDEEEGEEEVDEEEEEEDRVDIPFEFRSAKRLSEGHKFIQNNLDNTETNGKSSANSSCSSLHKNTSPRFRSPERPLVRSTASYLSNNSPSAAGGTLPPPGPAFPPNSPLRKAVAKHRESFVSLGIIIPMRRTSKFIRTFLIYIFRGGSS